jgi:thiamine biosynthesis lipoprotein
MASPLRLSVCRRGDDDRSREWEVDAAWAAVRTEFETAEAELSRFRATSDLTRLNLAAGSGRPVDVPRRLERALVAADRACRVTDGRFDPRVLRDLDRLGYRGATLGPGAASPAGDLAAGTRVVERAGPARAAVSSPVDLGGIGKGITLRWAAALLERRGVTRFLLEAGGDLVARGPGPDGDPWLVGIEDPAGGHDPLGAIAVEDGAVATSSIRIRSWVHDGRTVHHLLDPRTGEPVESGLRAVTVFGPDPAWAEVWSKTLFVGGGSAIAGEARGRGLAAWWVTDGGDLEMTPAARTRTAWVEGEGKT